MKEKGQKENKMSKKRDRKREIKEIQNKTEIN